jgi:hypothetical protein
MAKRVDFDAIDEKSVIDYVRNDRRTVPAGKPEEVTPDPVPADEKAEQEQLRQSGQPEHSEQPDRPETEAETEAEIIPAASEPPKEETRSKRSIHPEYESRFIRETDLPPARFGKSVYIRKEYHDRISQIVSVIGGNEVSLFGYIDNVLAHHFEYFQDDIIRSFRKKVIFK